MPPRGTFNLHGSLYLTGRGAAPITMVINGETETGVLLISSKKKLIRVNSHLQRTPISEDDTAGTVHDRLMEISIFSIENRSAIEANDYPQVPQTRRRRNKAARSGRFSKKIVR
jgi:methionyl-tRNA formyltransferase